MKLELLDVSCGYDKKRPLIEHINMELSSGEICCLLGPNGVGKTTLFKTILQLIPALSGRICLDGQDVAGWKAARRAKYLAYVAQAHVPSFPYLVRDVAMMGRLGQIGAFSSPSGKDYEAAEQALAMVGIRHLRDRAYTDISGGERQLLMIAKALAQEPKVLVMDEPTANLDYGNMVTVLECVRKLAAEGMCVIFTTHMPDQAFFCEAKTALLAPNAPMLFGSCGEVITEKNLYRAYHARIQVIELVGADGSPARICTPYRKKYDTGKERIEQ